jgi:hypothetical protein
LIRIDIPATLTDRERELYQELAKLSHFNPREHVAAQAAPHATTHANTSHQEKSHGTTTS